MQERFEALESSVVEAVELARSVTEQLDDVVTRLEVEESNRTEATEALAEALTTQSAALVKAEQNMAKELDRARVDMAKAAADHSVNRDRLASLLSTAADRLTN